MEDFGNKMIELVKHLEESRQRDKKEWEEERRKEKRELEEERKKEQLKLEEERKREKLEFREQLMAMQRLQLEQQVKSDQKIELLAQTLRNRNDDDENSFSQSAIWAAIDTFHHDPENGLTFEAYFRRFEDTFKIDCSQWADAKKVDYYCGNWVRLNMKSS